MKMMRTLIPTCLLLACLALPGMTQTAHAQEKIATVDLHKLFNGYWKTKQANVTLDGRKADLRKDLKDMQDGIEKGQQEYKDLQYSRQAESQLQDMVQRMNTSLLADIQAAVGAKAKLEGYSLVLNNTSDAVLYSKGDSDITADILAQLNAGAPIDVNAPATNAVSSPLMAPHNP
jgi:Skp family chaperone for outer membrane proteins